MSTPIDPVRQAIIDRIAAIPTIGLVHNRERFVKEMGKLKDLYVSDISGQTVLRGWYVHRYDFNQSTPTSGRTVKITTWHIRGFSGFDDENESGLVFDNLIDAIATTFRDDITLGGLTSGTDLEDGEVGIQLLESKSVMFANVLCHSALLQLTTVEFF